MQVTEKSVASLGITVLFSNAAKRSLWGKHGGGEVIGKMFRHHLKGTLAQDCHLFYPSRSITLFYI